MNKYITEFIGTFFFVLTVGTCVVNPAAGVIAPLAIGSVLMILVYAGGHISGGHYNPAVTVAVTLRGRCSAGDAIAYIIAQIIGASLAAGIVIYLKGSAPAAAPSAYTLGQMALAEFLFTFALAYVVLNVATAKANAGNSYFGLAIGFTVVVGAFAVGSISGGAFNPAIATGCAILGLLPAGHLAVYVVTELLAGALAAGVFRVLNPQDI
jgi:aquaporin Z